MYRGWASTLVEPHKEHTMRIHHALIATAAVGLTASIASTAVAQYAPETVAQYAPGTYGSRYHAGPYVGEDRGAYAAYDAPYAAPYAGSYYSYGADRANPSLAPNGWDLDNPRDFQLQGK